MFRGTAPRLTLIALVSATAAYVAVPFALPVQAAERTVRVGDNFFDPRPIDVEAGDTVVWMLDQAAQAGHSVTLDADGNNDFDDNNDGQFDLSTDLAPNTPSTVFRHTFEKAGQFNYFCRFHLVSDNMAGSVRVQDPPPPPPPPTTTTTAPPPTTTTTAPPDTTTTTLPAPPPTTATTRPRATTSTTRPPAPTPTTQPPAAASGETTDTTGRATTTKDKPTTTTGKKKPTTTTKPPETTTTTVAAPALPADWIPTPDIVPGDATTTTTGPDLEAALASRPKAPKGGGGGGGFPVTGALAALGALVLGGVGYAWHHRSSRYLPA